VRGVAFVESSHFGMSTVMTHGAYGRRASGALRAVRAEAARLEALLNRFLPASDIGRLNRMAGIGRVRVSAETADVLARAVEFSRRCPGLFDITVAPLVDLWRNGRETGTAPEGSAIRRALELVDCAGLLLDPRGKTAGLARPGQSVDLGGIGKGYAADRFLDVFRRYGVTSGYTNIGGNVAALGARPDGSPWRVGIRHPRREDALIGRVAVTDASVVTSGDYQRYFMDGEGNRFHHILDPATSRPAESGLAGVTVVAAGSMDADALSTALFVAGLQKGAELLKRFGGAEAVFIDTDLRAHVTPGLRGTFEAAEGIETEYLS
jgi:thiamine biosynthesis lipoprotein